MIEIVGVEESVDPLFCILPGVLWLVSLDILQDR